LAVCYQAGNETTNVVEAKNRKINLLFFGSSDALISRILSQKTATFSDGTNNLATQNDEDYLLNETEYEQFSYQYRVGYDSNSQAAVYEGKGKILCSGTGNLSINFLV